MEVKEFSAYDVLSLIAGRSLGEENSNPIIDFFFPESAPNGYDNSAKTLNLVKDQIPDYLLTENFDSFSGEELKSEVDAIVSLLDEKSFKIKKE